MSSEATTAGLDDSPLGDERTAELTSWLAEHGLAPATPLTPLVGGTQNVLLSFTTRDGERLVVRHGPRTRRQWSDESLRREVRTLGLLAGTRVPHPRVRAATTEDDSVGVFYVMEAVDGFNPAEGMTSRPCSQPPWRHDFGLDMARSLARLTTVRAEDAVRAGMRDPGDWHARQPGRWVWQVESYSDSPLAGPARKLAAWLETHILVERRLGLIHGDYHLGNVIASFEEPRVAAIVDWELATIGDPALDIAHLMVGWPVDNPRSAHADLDTAGLPTRDELRDEYFRTAGYDVADLLWFQVLACLRLGVLLEGTHAQALEGRAAMETGLRLHRLAQGLFDEAFEILDS